MTENLEKHYDEDITEALNRVADGLDTRLDEFGKEAARRTLASIEWDQSDGCLASHLPTN